MVNEDNKIKLYKHLLKKYADIINQREQRTIGEIKSLVNGTDLTVQQFIDEFKDPFYKFEEDYFDVLKEVYEKITKEIEFTEIETNINYWLSAKEIIELKVADDEDFAVFTCACMKALDDDKAEVIIAELDNLKPHAFVITTINDKYLLIDPTQKHDLEKYYGNKLDVVKNYTYENQKIKRFLYRFNSNKYEQFFEDT
ncbi:MAG: transglutaminase-like domain-containing protein [Candidatus ainarchaeum sp.]|nr:transglutaminase-like domain-containing protein [Candidatus ainarchaeum sp.]